MEATLTTDQKDLIDGFSREKLEEFIEKITNPETAVVWMQVYTVPELDYIIQRAEDKGII